MATLSTKACQHCEVEFEPSHWRQVYCKPGCRTMAYNKNNPEQARKNAEKTAERQKKNYKQRREYLDAYKAEKGCCNCGFSNPIALQFNHIDPQQKSFQVSEGLAGRPWKLILQEIEKCNVMCANCHAIHTYENEHTRITRLGKT